MLVSILVVWVLFFVPYPPHSSLPAVSSLRYVAVFSLFRTEYGRRIQQDLVFPIVLILFLWRQTIKCVKQECLGISKNIKHLHKQESPECNRKRHGVHCVTSIRSSVRWCGGGGGKRPRQWLPCPVNPLACFLDIFWVNKITSKLFLPYLLWFLMAMHRILSFHW